jgi:hypothetical protein
MRGGSLGGLKSDMPGVLDVTFQLCMGMGLPSSQFINYN